MTGLTARGFLSLTAFQAEGCGGGFAADFIKKGRGWRRRLCRRVMKRKVLKMDRPLAGGFLSLTGLWPEGCGGGFAASLLKSALRDWLSVSYGMIRMLRIGSLRSPPPIRLRRTFPHPGNRINRSMLSCRDMAPRLSIHSPTTKWWQGNLIRKEP